MKTDILTSGSMVKKPHLIKNAIRIPCNTENFVPIVVPGLSASSSSGSYHSTSRTNSRQESHYSTSSSSSSSSPTATSSDNETREREDRTGQSIGTTRCGPSQSKSKTNEKGTQKLERDNPLCSDIREWLQEFGENLVDDEIPEHGDSHASSSHEASLEPVFKRREDLCKHSVETHFPQDRNCEICQRTKITRAPCPVPRAENVGDLITADVQKTQWRSRTSC